jgi:hypothetical protein
MKHICETAQRFSATAFSRASVRFEQDASSGCWSWLGAVDRSGYGKVKVMIARRPRYTGAHRASWIARRGPIPNGMVIDHLCRNTLCINPAHMEIVTGQENNRRRKKVGRPTVALKDRRGCKQHGTTQGCWRASKDGYMAWICQPCSRLRARMFRERRGSYRLPQY